MLTRSLMTARGAENLSFVNGERPGASIFIKCRVIPAPQMGKEKSCAKALPFGKRVADVLDQKMIEDVAKIVNVPIKDKCQVPQHRLPLG